MSRELAHSSARVLEFDSLRHLLRGYASSPLGQQRIAALAPTTDRDWIQTQQELALEIREFRRVGGRFDFSGLIDVGQLVDKSRIAGAALETTEIRDVILVVDRAAEWREIALHPPANMKSDWQRVRALSGQIADFTEFLRHFRNKIQPDGTLEDKASPELARIRRDNRVHARRQVRPAFGIDVCSIHREDRRIPRRADFIISFIRSQIPPGDPAASSGR